MDDMKTFAVFLIMLTGLLHGAFEQSYVHEFKEDGSSVITKDMSLSAFSVQLGEEGIEQIAELCDNEPALGCSVNTEAGSIILTENITTASEYYYFEADYGFPHMTYYVEIYRIPSERFTGKIDEIMKRIGTETRSAEKPRAINLKEDNTAQARSLRQLGAEISYEIVMPVEISAAAAGEVQGRIEQNRAVFDVVGLLGQKETINVKSQSLNLGIIVLVLGIVVLLGLGAWFWKGSRQI